MGSERGLKRNFNMTATSHFDNTHKAGYSRLYGIKDRLFATFVLFLGKNILQRPDQPTTLGEYCFVFVR